MKKHYSGPQIMANSSSKYETAFAKWFGVQHAFAFFKGRVAMYTILKALGIGPGDEVIMPGYTCVMNVTPIKYLGAKPVYVDIEPDTYNIDINLLEEKITPHAKVIIAQHTYGYPIDMDKLLDIANRKGIPVVEDCCLALGSRYKGKIAGTFGIAAYFSSQWSKPYTTGIGGMAIWDDAELAQKIGQIRNKELKPVPAKQEIMLGAQLALYRALVYPRTTALLQYAFRYLSEKNLMIGSTAKQELEELIIPVDFFMGMSATQARAGIRQISRINQNLQHRKKIAGLYDELLGQHGWEITKVPEHTEPILVRYPVRITDKNGAIIAAAKHGIALGTWFISPLHNVTKKLEMYDYIWGMCPVAEKATREVVNLPLHLRTLERTAHRTFEFICKFQQAT